MTGYDYSLPRDNQITVTLFKAVMLHHFCLNDCSTVTLKDTRPITNEMHHGMKVIAQKCK